MTKQFRITPRLTEIDGFVSAANADAALLKAAAKQGFDSVPHLNAAIDDLCKAEEVSDTYVTALETIAKEVGDYTDANLSCRDDYTPNAAAENAMRTALAESGAADSRSACNRICADLRYFGIPAGDWLFKPMTKLAA